MEISREVIAGEVPILPIEGHIELDGEPGILPEFHEPEERDNLDDLSWGSTEFSFPGGQRPGPGRSAWPNHPSGRQGLGGFVRRLLLFGLLLLGGRSFFLGDGASPWDPRRGFPSPEQREHHPGDVELGPQEEEETREGESPATEDDSMEVDVDATPSKATGKRKRGHEGLHSVMYSGAEALSSKH
ncbi:hypothetical protein VDGL01_02299 [Verticillium dahliae]